MKGHLKMTGNWLCCDKLKDKEKLKQGFWVSEMKVPSKKRRRTTSGIPWLNMIDLLFAYGTTHCLHFSVNKIVLCLEFLCKSLDSLQQRWGQLFAPLLPCTSHLPCPRVEIFMFQSDAVLRPPWIFKRFLGLRSVVDTLFSSFLFRGQ